MKPQRFSYRRARSREEALDLLAHHAGEARVLAGGQSLMPMLNMRLAAPALLVDINPLSDLAGISVADGRLRIGALTRHREVAESSLVRAHAPLLSLAMAHVGHPAIRNRGTIGGSLANADPAAEMPACCLALDARMIVESSRGTRTIGADDFLRGIFDTAIEPDELLAAIEIPVPVQPWRPGFKEFARRHGDFALVGAAAVVQEDKGRASDMRLVLFGAGERALRARGAETALMAEGDPAAKIAQACEALADDIAPMSDIHASAEMRMHLARVLVRRLAAELDVGIH